MSRTRIFQAESARRLTAQKVAQAIGQARSGQFKPYKPTLPMAVTIHMRTSEAAQAAAGKPGVKRVDEYTVETLLARRCDVIKWIVGIGLDMPPKGK